MNPPPLEPRVLSIRDHLERVMPEGGRGRRIVGWGIVAWTGIGIAILLFALGRLLGRLGGILPYLIVAALVVVVLNPLVRRSVAWGIPRRLAAV